MSIPETNMRALTAFAAAAEDYCAFINALADDRLPNLHTRLEGLLARLSATILPVCKDMSDMEDREFEKLRMTHEKRCEIAQAISSAVSEQALRLYVYHEELSSTVESGDDHDATRASMLWDDLSDIYCDLRDGLVLWQLGTPDAQAEASWQWRYDYEIHWGDHLFRAMTTVHEARYRISED